MNTLLEDNYKEGITAIHQKYRQYFNEKLDISSIIPTDYSNNAYPNLPSDIIEFFIHTGRDIENLHCNKTIKKSGRYCTNNIEMVDLIISEIIDFNTVLDKRILEPSCGYGIFILRIIYLMHKYEHSRNEIINFINNNLVGFDISSIMVEFTCLNIKLLMLHLYKDIKILDKIKPQIYLTDTTYKPDSNRFDFTKSDNAENIKLNALTGNSKFDYIIGNPPYVTLYGRRDNKKSEDLREYYIKNYKFIPDTVKNGKLNISMFFFEQALDWVKDGGHISFIVDISLFETAYCYLRKYILEESKVKSLITEVKAFDVASGQVIISLQKSETKNLKNIVQIINYETGEKQEVRQGDWYKADNEYKFEIIDNKAKEILMKIEAKSQPLKHFFKEKSLRTCCMLLDMEDLFTSDKPIQPDFDVLPFFEGSKSLKEPYGKLTFNKYLVYNKPLQDQINDKLKKELTLLGIKNKKRIGLGNLEVHKSPKVFIRQSAKRLIASLYLEPACANNSLYCLSEAKNDTESINKLKIACSQLNSEISTFYALARRIIRTSKGKQPQIKIADLKNIPLTFDKEITKKILKLLHNPHPDQNSIKTINDLLYGFYQINKEEIRFIREFIQKY